MMRYRHLGTRKIETTGAFLIGNASHIASEAWLNSVYPCLSEQETTELETLLDTTIPPEYRYFLQNISNGMNVLVDELCLFGKRNNYIRTSMDATRQPFNLRDALGWPMLRDSNFENLIGYTIAYITSLGLNSLGGIIAWQLSTEKTHWLLFAFYQWIAHMVSITLVLVSISFVDSIFFTDNSLLLSHDEISDSEMIVVILYMETLIFACSILVSSYLAKQIGKCR